MREIKFRAWDKDEHILGRVRRITWVNRKISDVQIENFGLKKLDQIILMQYTGLKDINGVEIYEGDIIREYVEKDGPPLIVSVVWEEGAFYGKEPTHNPVYILKEFLNGEVIGNIYQNKYLLED